MRLSELDFDFPKELIAQEPAEPRDSCRLMFLASDGTRRHMRFSDISALLRCGDTIVFNDSRVLPARVEARKPTGGRVELLFLHPRSDEEAAKDRGPSLAADHDGRAAPELWEALARPSHRLREGGRLLLPEGEEMVLRALLGDGRWLVEGPASLSMVEAMERHGRLPLPPYIGDYRGDPEAYQTVYAASPGSAAAPTAGLHFTPEVLGALAASGVCAAHVTLHVGLDTFQPIREEIVEEHRIHREAFSISQESLAVVRKARSSGGRLVAVGTTAARVLETLAVEGLLEQTGESGAAVGQRLSGTTDIFITPGYRFEAVDALLTNFHLPRSTVLALVMAFAGPERIRTAYREAIDLGYRFFSFGDAMLIERDQPSRPGVAVDEQTIGQADVPSFAENDDGGSS